MKNKMLTSFRYRIVWYSLLSLFLSILTVIALSVSIVLVYLSLGGTVDGLVKVQMVSTRASMDDSGVSSVAEEEQGLVYNGFIQNDSHMMLGIILALCIMLFFILFILYQFILTKNYGNYMLDITKGINEISHGNYGEPIMIEGNDEFAHMADELNHMARRIDDIIQNDRMNEEQKNELITSVTHDLRTPLTSIIGYLELVKNKDLDSFTREKYIGVAYNKSKRLEQMVEDLFTYTKYNYGDVRLAETPVDLVKLVEQLTDEFYPSFQENGLQYEFKTDCNSLVSCVDGNLLARAIANLIGNAIKYGKEGKSVEIYLTHTETMVDLQIINYGEIIPDNELSRIFDRFYRVESSRSYETGGSGLGLAIAKSIVLMHNGDILVQSNLEGTVFEIKLPIVKR